MRCWVRVGLVVHTRRMLCSPAHNLPAYGAVLKTRRFSAVGRDNPPDGFGRTAPPGERSVWDPEASLRGSALELVNDLLDRPDHSRSKP